MVELAPFVVRVQLATKGDDVFTMLSSSWYNGVLGGSLEALGVTRMLISSFMGTW